MIDDDDDVTLRRPGGRDQLQLSITVSAAW